MKEPTNQLNVPSDSQIIQNLDEEELYNLEEILDVKFDGGQILYGVKFTNVDRICWEPASSFLSDTAIQDMLDFRERNREKINALLTSEGNEIPTIDLAEDDDDDSKKQSVNGDGSDYVPTSPIYREIISPESSPSYEYVNTSGYEPTSPSYSPERCEPSTSYQQDGASDHDDKDDVEDYDNDEDEDADSDDDAPLAKKSKRIDE